MPSETRSSTSLQVVSGSCEDGKVNSLKLASSSPTPSTSSSSPRCSLKRKVSKIYTDTDSVAVHPRSLKMHQSLKRTRLPPPPLTLPCIPSPSIADADPTDPPSPVPTEIIDIEAEDFVRTAKMLGVKVRDYAVEPPIPPLPQVKDVWRDPFHTLLVHDIHIRRPSQRDYCLPGKFLRRLLDIKYVTQKEVDAYWTDEDRTLLKEYDDRPSGRYPYVIACRRPKPTAAYRISARKMVHGEPLPGDIPDAHIKVPDDGEWEGDEESWAFERLMKQNRETYPPPPRGRPLGLESVAPLDAFNSYTKPTICSLPERTPPVHTTSLPETPTYKKSGELDPLKSGEPSTPTTPPVALTPTTPTSPPASTLKPLTNRRGLGRTATLATLSVR